MPVMQSRDPFLQVSVLKVSGLVLVLKVKGLSHKPIVLRLWILQGYSLVELL